MLVPWLAADISVISLTRLQRISFLTKNWQSWQKYWFLMKF